MGRRRARCCRRATRASTCWSTPSSAMPGGKTFSGKSGRLPMAQLPSNYSTIYMLSTLPDAALERAREAGLLRPDLKRSEVVAFKRRILTLDERPDPDEVRRRRIAALRRQRAEIDEEI